MSVIGAGIDPHRYGPARPDDISRRRRSRRNNGSSRWRVGRVAGGRVLRSDRCRPFVEQIKVTSIAQSLGTRSPGVDDHAKRDATGRLVKEGTVDATINTPDRHQPTYHNVMAGRPGRAWRRRHPYERLVEAYRDAHEKLGNAYNARPFPRARTDSPEVRAFLQKLTRANLSLRLLRTLCKKNH